MVSPIQIYSLLRRHFGPRGWWPTTPAGQNQPVYHSSPRINGLSDAERFEICLGAILTQNTAWTNVEKALCQLSRVRALTPERIASMSFLRLCALVRSSGYFRQKAKKLKIFARYLLRKYGGSAGRLLAKPAEELRVELLRIYGVGPETADSMLLYAGGHAVFVVDAYTRRIGRRIGLFETEDYEKIRSYFERNLERSPELFNEFHALLVALGKDICRPKPRCELCPLRKDCRTGAALLRGRRAAPASR